MYKPDNITPPENLFEEAKEIHEYLKDGYNVDSGLECTQRAAQLAVYMARSGKMLADSKYHKDALIKNEVMKLLQQQLQEFLTASTINKLLDATCKDYNYLVNWITEIDKEVKYQVELMRTFISQAKELRKTEHWTQNSQNND